MQKIIHFIKYNNATVIILAVVLIMGGGALAAGPEAIGQKQTSIEGVDNSALLTADLTSFNMDFQISKIEADDKFYYIIYTYLDLGVLDNAWQYQLKEKKRKITKNLKEDLGLYLAEQLKEEYDARLKSLREEQAKAAAGGPAARVEVTEYGGLIGKTLDLTAKVFPGYEPVKKVELPAPEFNPPTPLLKVGETGEVASEADNLTKIYNDYVAAHPEIFETPVAPTETASSTPEQSETASSTPETPADTATGETPAEPGETPAPAEPTAEPAPEPESAPTIPEPNSVDIIELPVPPAEPESAPAANDASAETAPEPASEPAQ